MDAKELARLDRYCKRLFNNAAAKVRARPQKKDSAELYLGEEFVGVLFRDDEDGDLSYSLQIAILDADLEG